MDITMANGLRADLEANKNRSLLGGAQMAINAIYNIEKNISLITEGLSIFEEEDCIPICARKIGPSGKPVVIIIECKSQKEAYEKAKHAGKGEPVHHPKPKKGKAHYHPNGNRNDHIGLDKNIQKDGTHFTYPD